MEMINMIDKNNLTNTEPMYLITKKQLMDLIGCNNKILRSRIAEEIYDNPVPAAQAREEGTKAEREHLVGFHSELKAYSEIELIEEQKEFSDGLKESLCILYRWFPELRSPEQKQEPVKESLADLCPYCNKPMRWDQFKEIWICPSHGKFDKGKDRDLK